MTTLAPDQSSPKPGQKQSLWYHLHFWIGWIAALPIALVCLTGAMLVFATNINQWENKELFQLEPTGPRPPIAQVLAPFDAAQPRYLVRHLGIPTDPRHAYKAYATQLHPEGNRNMEVYVNPYTGELTPLTGRFSFAVTLTEFHRNLVAGETGQAIVAICSVLLAITCIFGAVLWWPLRARTFARAWKRGQPLDWHNALGVVALIPLIVMAVTGVTLTWGNQIFPFLEKMQNVPSRLKNPLVVAPANAVALPFQTVADRVAADFPGVRVTGVQPSNSPKSAHVFIMDDAGHNLKVHMDPYTGKQLMTMDGSGTGPVGWYRDTQGKLHTFAPYGLFWRVIWGLLSLAGTVLVVTGVWVSIKRWRREKRAAA